MKLKNLLALGLSAILAGSAFAGDVYEKVVIEEPLTFCDRYENFFDVFDIYESDHGILRSFEFTGRYQGEWFHNTQDVGNGAFAGDDNDTDWFNRRFRFGWKAKLLDSFTFAGEFNLDLTWDNDEVSALPGGANGPRAGEVGFFQSLDFVELEWEINDRLTFAIGKIDPKVTLEDSISSKRLYTIERSSASEMVNHDKSAGAAIEIADVLGNDFRFGVYNGGTEDDHLTNRPALEAQITDLPQTNGRWGYEFKLDRNLWSAPQGPKAPITVLQSVDAGLWWFHAEDADAEYAARAAVGVDDNFEEFTDVVSFNTRWTANRWGILTDLLFANIDNQIDNDADATGLVIMPYYDITDRLQFVYRYNRIWADGDGVAGVGTGADIDGELRTGSGTTSADSLVGNYFGLNYYICGHKLKLQFGAEHTELDLNGAAVDTDYWSFQSAIKMYW